MEAHLDSNLHTGRPEVISRVAASLFVLVCIPGATWGLTYVPSRIFVPKDAIATANNLLANEFLFRTAIVSHLVSAIGFAVMILLFASLFRPVNRLLSQMMIVPVIAELAIVLVLEIFNVTALMILKGEALTSVDPVQKQEIAFLFLRMHRYGIGIAQVFWGLCFIPFGLALYQSRFAPKIIGILLVVSGVGYVADCAGFVLLQRPDYAGVQPFIRATFIGFMLAILWLLIKGVQTQQRPDPKP
ncbi:MAG: DUF4386 domain-containing protein [Cyclobacteriaceae bacterium]|nr:DUF4386 domain-containing protein [Cyclobacteriaceae bacterium]